MVTGIVMRNCTDVRINNVSMEGLDTAFEIYDSEDIRLNDVQLHSTRTAVTGERVRRLAAKNVQHSDAGWAPRVSPLAMAVWRVIHGNV